MLLLTNGNFTPFETYRGYGVDAYVNYPVDITREFGVVIPFYSGRTMTYELYYHVLNPEGQEIYSHYNFDLLLGTNETFYLTFKPRLSIMQPGHNRLILFYRMKGGDRFYEHHSSFFGFIPDVFINLNDEEDARAKFENEVVFIYDGFRKKTVHYRRTHLSFSGLGNSVYYDHDLKLDLPRTYMHTTATYKANFYKDVRFYFGNHAVFPYFMKTGKGAELLVKLEQHGNYIYMVPDRTLYIDPLTQHTSPVARPGFVATDKYYFPKYRFNDINNVTCLLRISGFGFNKFNIEYTFQIEVGRSFLGPDGNHQAIIIRS